MSMSVRSSNGKSKALKGSAQDYTNLLFSDSESEGKVPDLRLPPIKGKKQKRRRNVGLRPDDTCGPWNVLKVLFVILILAGMTALAAVTFWSLKKITEMQDQIEKLQKVDAATPDTIALLQKRLTTLNISVMALKSTAGDMKSQIGDINQKEFLKLLKEMKYLNSTKANLEDKLDKVQKVDTLQNTVVGLGQDMKQLQTEDLPNLRADIKKLQDRMTADVSEPQVNGEEELTLGPFISQLQDELTAMNKSLNQEIAVSRQKVSDLEKVLEAYTNAHSSDVDLSAESLNEQILETVKRLMKNGTISNDKQVKNQTDDSSNSDTMEVWTKQSDFLLFKEEMLTDIKSINSTLENFSEEFEAVQKHLMFNHHMITNLSILVERNSQKEREPPKEAEPTVPLETTTQNATATLPLEEEVKDEETKEETGSDVEDNENRLRIPGINNETALHERFEALLTEGMDGHIPVTDLATGLGLSVEELSPYDTDHDGNLSEREMKIAMGFLPDLKRRRKRNDW